MNKALKNLSRKLKNEEVNKPISFSDYLETLKKKPEKSLRNVFQLASDMISHHIPEAEELLKNPKPSLTPFNLDSIFIEGMSTPFFADHTFAEKFVKHVNTFKYSARQNKVYFYEGPPGTGKSTFLNNFLQKLEEFTYIPEGAMYETVWNLDPRNMTRGKIGFMGDEKQKEKVEKMPKKQLLVPCPSHDHPILQIPKEYRREFLEEIIKNSNFKDRLFNDNAYEWVFSNSPCAVCSSMYDALGRKLDSPEDVLKALYVRKNLFNRKLGEGISIFNPGDSIKMDDVETNLSIQKIINMVLGPSAVQYVYSSFARTNNGVYAIMDLKEANQKRMMNLHGIVSDGVHKVDRFEEKVNSLFLALANPEDSHKVNGMESFKDRIEHINVPHTLNYKSQTEILKQKFGSNIENDFVPGILDNFSKLVLSTRLNISKTDSMRAWINNPSVYKEFSDPDLLLLKMELYTGNIPSWLKPKERKNLGPERIYSILRDRKKEGEEGISGRKAISLFEEFYSKRKKDEPLDMEDLAIFFDIGSDRLARYIEGLRSYDDEEEGNPKALVPEGFLESMYDVYDNGVLNQIKESLFDFNEERIQKDIKNYLFTLTLDVGDMQTCPYTGEEIGKDRSFMRSLEKVILGDKKLGVIRDYRKGLMKKFVSNTQSYEMGVEGKTIDKTFQFNSLYDAYKNNLKDNVLEPVKGNPNFRRAILAYGTKEFNDAYDKTTKKNTDLLLNNLQKKFKYTLKSAQDLSVYAIDNLFAKD